MVKYILETDKPKSYLSYYEWNPRKVSFVFDEEEFNLEKLDKLSRENNRILNERILRECVKKINQD